MESSFFKGIGIGRVDSPFWDAIGADNRSKSGKKAVNKRISSLEICD